MIDCSAHVYATNASTTTLRDAIASAQARNTQLNAPVVLVLARDTYGVGGSSGSGERAGHITVSFPLTIMYVTSISRNYILEIEMSDS